MPLACVPLTCKLHVSNCTHCVRMPLAVIAPRGPVVRMYAAHSLHIHEQKNAITVAGVLQLSIFVGAITTI